MHEYMPEKRQVRNGFNSINNNHGRNIHNVVHPKYQSRPLSNYTTAQQATTDYLGNDRKKPTAMNATKTQQSRARDNVKFEYSIPTHQEQQHQQKMNTKKRIGGRSNNQHYTAQNRELYDMLCNENSCIESEIDSIYSSSAFHDDESETESLEDEEDYNRRTIQRFETKVNTMTNRFVNKVKSEVDQTFSKIKLQSKFNGAKVKAREPTERPTGDGRARKNSIENDEYIKKMLKVKMNCYQDIQKCLETLQKVDQLTEMFYRNHVSND